MTDTAHIERRIKVLVVQGKLIEAGWLSFRLACLRPNAASEQLEEMRAAWMAGAQYTFGMVMGLFDEDPPRSGDYQARLEAINTELEGFVAELEARFGPAH